MEYRKLPHGEKQISVIGMGSSVVGEQKEKDIIQTVEYALEQGVNFFDMAGGHASIFPGLRKGLAGAAGQRAAAGTFRGGLHFRGIWMDDQPGGGEALRGLAVENAENRLY